jgi:hypothetical protein
VDTTSAKADCGWVGSEVESFGKLRGGGGLAIVQWLYR